MGMLLHRHLMGAKKPPVKVEEPKLNNELKEKEKANDNKRKNNNSKNISKRFDFD